MALAEWISNALLIAGAVFFFAGTVGLLRFPDVYTRLHALAKADNLGLGLVMFGLLLRAPGWATGIKLVLIWLLALLASATVGFLIARRARHHGIAPWRSGDGE